MVKKIKISKKLIAGLLASSIILAGPISYKIHRNSEVKRVKGYLSDFQTEDNYVDLSKISSTYPIKNFKGEYLYEALKDSDIKYVRITDSYIYDGAHVTPFKQKNAVNYEEVLYVDEENNPIYAMYEPIAVSTEDGIKYIIPDDYTLEDIYCISEPIRYEELTGRDIIVNKNNYEESYSLSLTNGKNR